MTDELIQLWLWRAVAVSAIVCNLISVTLVVWMFVERSERLLLIFAAFSIAGTACSLLAKSMRRRQLREE